MDTEDNLPPFSSKPNGKLLQSLPPVHTAEAEESSGQTVDLAWVFAVARRRSVIIAGVALVLMVSSGLGLVWSKRKTIPEYQGSFKLLVEPATAEDRLRNQFLMSQNQGLDIQSVQLDRSLLDYETQIRVLKSPQIMNPVVQQLRTRYPDINYNSLLQSLSIERVTFKIDEKQEGTKILEVAYKDKDTKKIEFVLKTIADTYLNYSLQERQKSLNQGLEFIEAQLPNLQQQVDTLQAKLQKLRQQYNMTNPEEANRFLTGHVLEIRTQRLATEVELAETRALYNTLKRQLSEAKPTAVLSSEGEAYRTLISELQKIETQIASDSTRFREDSPPMKALREKQQNLRLLLSQQAEGKLEKVAGQMQGLEDRYKTIVQTENQVNQKLEQLPTVSRQVIDLQQKIDVATNNLKEFLVKRESLKLDAAQQEVPWQLINPPELWRNDKGIVLPVEANSIKRPLVIAVILSWLLGIGVGFLVEILNTVFHTPEEIKGATKLPILGVIPFAKKLQKLPKKLNQVAIVAQVANLPPAKDQLLLAGNDNQPNGYSASPFTEAFRSLYTNIRLLSSQKPIYSLAISSAVPADGKTTIAVYLAQTAAAIGQRVLLVDADLRFPQLHSRLSLPNVQGLSETIATDLDLNDAIQQSPLYDNLFVLTAGRILSDPIKLLSSDRMQYLMEQFQARFDLVIYDMPPLLGLGDGNLLAANADGTLLVVGLEQTDRSQLMKALEGLKISGASILGIVANGMRGHAANSYASYRRR
jgi:capsular exopolysaccharide synthesis family protein